MATRAAARKRSGPAPEGCLICGGRASAPFLRREDDPPLPPDREPEAPVEEPPTKPQTEPNAPVREPGPPQPKRLTEFGN
jgi:hypothetical protein